MNLDGFKFIFPSKKAAWFAALALVLTALLGGALGGGAAVAILGGQVEENTDSINTTEDVVGIVADALKTNCQGDLKARRQYRRRAIVEKRLTTLERRSNRLQAKANKLTSRILVFSAANPAQGATDEGLMLARESAKVFRRISRLQSRIADVEKRLHDEITILPIRRCSEMRRDLLAIR